MLFRGVIFDRDGTLNVRGQQAITHPDDLILIPGTHQAIQWLNERKIKTAIATNQSGVSTGMMSQETLSAIHDRLLKQLRDHHAWIDQIIACTHAPNLGCDCRKPNPGQLLTIAKQWSMPPSDLLVIGDSYIDIEAARRAGCAMALVKTGRGQETLDHYPVPSSCYQFKDAKSAIQALFL